MVYSPQKKNLYPLLIFPVFLLLPLVGAIFDPEGFLSIFIIFCLPILIILWFVMRGHPKRLHLEEDGLVIDRFLKRSKQIISYFEIESVELKNEAVRFRFTTAAFPILYLKCKRNTKPMRLDFGNGPQYDDFLSKLKEKVQSDI